jgi:hypothetical protein
MPRYSPFFILVKIKRSGTPPIAHEKGVETPIIIGFLLFSQTGHARANNRRALPDSMLLLSSSLILAA